MMFLNEDEVRQALDGAKAAFPQFADWKYNSKKNADHSDFALWGEYVHGSDEMTQEHFFVTFEMHKAKWKGILSIGQHAFFWSSADFGDAYLVDTEACTTLEDAIRMLKMEIRSLFKAFLN